jgi:hypothetical protein
MLETLDMFDKAGSSMWNMDLWDEDDFKVGVMVGIFLFISSFSPRLVLPCVYVEGWGLTGIPAQVNKIVVFKTPPCVFVCFMWNAGPCTRNSRPAECIKILPWSGAMGEGVFFRW